MRPAAILLALATLAGCDNLDGMEDARAAVRKQLKDPQSAEFREMSVCSKNKGIVRGEVNARNSFGGMAGFKPFYVVNGYARFPDDFEPIEHEGAIYSFGYQLMRACYDGADPDPMKFMNSVEAGTAMSDDAYEAEIDARTDAILNEAKEGAKTAPH